MTCEDREKKLPAYLEGELPPQEMEEIEAHLASCETCRSTLENLKAADHLVRNLGDVEPPPWMKQQIMARVREAHAESEGFWRKFFYPLHIKIPVQAFAVIVITVLAFYVYRQDEPQLRMQGYPLPTTPSFEIRKEQAAPEIRTSRSKRRVPSRDAEQQEEIMPAPQLRPPDQGEIYAPAAPSEKAEETIPADINRDVRDGLANKEPVSAEKSPALRNDESAWLSAMKEKRAVGSPPQAIAGASNKVCEQDGCTVEEREGRGAAGFSIAKGTVIKDTQPSLDFLLTVKDAAAAIKEVSEYLVNNDARHTEMNVQGKQQVLTTEIRSYLMENFLEKLSKIGLLSDRGQSDLGKDVQWVRVKITIIPAADQTP